MNSNEGQRGERSQPVAGGARCGIAQVMPQKMWQNID